MVILLFATDYQDATAARGAPGRRASRRCSLGFSDSPPNSSASSEASDIILYWSSAAQQVGTDLRLSPGVPLRAMTIAVLGDSAEPPQSVRLQITDAGVCSDTTKQLVRALLHATAHALLECGLSSVLSETEVSSLLDRTWTLDGQAWTAIG